MSKRYFIGPVILAAMVAISILVVALAPSGSMAASHREAPLISYDPTADITDFFLFRSYEPGREDRIVLVMDVIPGEEPGLGPNYYNFDPRVLYTINLDNDGDGIANDVRFELQFVNEIRGIVREAGLFLSYVALPPITALDGPGSEGLGLRQSYHLNIVVDGVRNRVASGLIAVPSNVGPRTMPDYGALVEQGIYEVEFEGHPIRVFAGQRDDPFYIDVAAIFDTLNLRRSPPLLTPEEDADDTTNPFGVDTLAGFNVHTIAIEVPAGLLTADGRGPDETDQPVIGSYAATYRRQVTVLGREDINALGAEVEQLVTESDGDAVDGSDLIERFNRWVQVQRLANPLVNETIIGTIDKDQWNSLAPQQESRFLDYYLNPRLALALELVFGVPAGTTGRTDLVDLLLKYTPEDELLSELLRLDISVPPTPLEEQRRMGPLAATPDPAAWPNGRRPVDDVTDIAVRVVGGSNYIAAMAGDGVNVNDMPFPNTFPFIPTPWDGRDHIHQNP